MEVYYLEDVNIVLLHFDVDSRADECTLDCKPLNSFVVEVSFVCLPCEDLIVALIGFHHFIYSPYTVITNSELLSFVRRSSHHQSGDCHFYNL